METRRKAIIRAIFFVAVGLILICWLTISLLAKRTLVRNLSSNNMTVRVDAAKRLLEAEKLEDLLPAQPVIRRSKTAQALGEIGTEEAMRVLGVILKDQEEAPRRWARQALAKQGRRAIPTLLTVLSATGGTKDETVKAFKQIGPIASPYLRLMLSDRTTYTNAAEAAAKAGGAGISALIHACYSPDADLRAPALDNLGLEKVPAALKPALDNLDAKKDPNSAVANAIKALGLIGDPTATSHLLKFLKDKANRVYAVTALGQIGNIRAVEPIIATTTESEKLYRNAAILALHRIGAPAFPALIRELRSPQPLMRQAAASALVGSKSPQVVPALIAASKSPDAQVRASSALALGWKGDREAVSPLIAALNDTDWRTIDAAVSALGEIGPQASGYLFAALRKPDQPASLKYQMARSLAAMGPPIVPELITALSDANPDVQMWSVIALGQIGDPRAVAPLRHLYRSASGDLKWAAEEQLRRLTGGA